MTPTDQNIITNQRVQNLITKNQSEIKHFGNQIKKDHNNHLTVVMTGPQTPETNTLETKTLETNTLETNTLETNTLETNTDHNIEIKDNAQKKTTNISVGKYPELWEL